MVRISRRHFGKTFIPAAYVAVFSVALLSLSCSKSNNLFFGRVEARVGSHIVIVTDCYRITVPPPEVLRDSANLPVHRFYPCADAEVIINGDQLLVNGKSYGAVGAGDTVMVDHGKVLVNGRAPSFGISLK